MPTTQGFALTKIPKPEHRKECFDVQQMESLSLVNCLSRFKEDLQHLQTARTCSFICFLVFLKRQALAFWLIAGFSILRGYISKHLEGLSCPFYRGTSLKSRAQPAYFAKPMTFLFERHIDWQNCYKKPNYGCQIWPGIKLINMVE